MAQGKDLGSRLGRHALGSDLPDALRRNREWGVSTLPIETATAARNPNRWKNLTVVRKTTAA